jgi:uncharacterized protein (DUF983 family)
VNVLFACPNCEAPARVSLDRPSDWQCPGCDHHQHFDAGDPALPACAVCGNHELYKQKDFPHRLGMLILIVGLSLSIYTYFCYEKWQTYAILIGTALIDGILYSWVGDAVVCYRCGAHHKNVTPGPNHHPFEITIGERYRQERIRREQLKARQGPA